MNSIMAWHFAKKNKRLNYGDNRLIKIGETHSVDISKKDLQLCAWGLHGSKHVFDALHYAPGPILYRVELSGEMIIGDNKIVAEKRKYVAELDATDILRKFARLCALDVIHLWDAPEIVIKYLKTGDEALRSSALIAVCNAAVSWAAAAAGAAANTETRAAIGAATGTTAGASVAAWDAARDAAWAAAWYDAEATAWDAAWDAANKKQRARLSRMVNTKFRKLK